MLHTSQCENIISACQNGVLNRLGAVNSLPLSNLNDSDLSNTEWQTNPLPRNMVTDASFEYAKFTIALQSKKVFDKLVSESETFSYATVLEVGLLFLVFSGHLRSEQLDRGYRQILDQLPDDWKTEVSSIRKR